LELTFGDKLGAAYDGYLGKEQLAALPAPSFPRAR
jgi:hypothetical protein